MSWGNLFSKSVYLRLKEIAHPVEFKIVLYYEEHSFHLKLFLKLFVTILRFFINALYYEL